MTPRHEHPTGHLKNARVALRAIQSARSGKHRGAERAILLKGFSARLVILRVGGVVVLFDSRSFELQKKR
jgi:hypothetical protein